MFHICFAINTDTNAISTPNERERERESKSAPLVFSNLANPQNSLNSSPTNPTNSANLNPQNSQNTAAYTLDDIDYFVKICREIYPQKGVLL